MATRLYLDAIADAVPISPAPDAAWEDTSLLTQVLCDTTKSGEAMSTVSFADALSSSNKDILFRQYVSRPLKVGQSITGAGSYKMQCRVSETNIANNMFLTFGIRIIASDGTTVNKTLLAVTRDASEASTSLVNRRISPAASAVYTTVAGDRIVVEVGMGGSTGGSGTHSSSMRLGSASATDLPEDDTTTTDDNPWVEIPDTLAFADVAPTDTVTLTDAATPVLTPGPPPVAWTATPADSVSLADAIRAGASSADSVSLSDAAAVSVGKAAGDAIALSDTFASVPPPPAAFDADAQDCKVVALDSTRFLVAWSKGVGDGLSAVVGVLSGGVISFGAALTTIGPSSTYSAVALAALSPTKAVLVAEKTFSGVTLVGYVLTVSGLDVTVGAASANLLSTTPTNFNMAMCALDASTVLLACGEATAAPPFGSAARVGTVSGTDITWGAATAFNSAGRTTLVDVCKMTAAAAVVAFNDVEAGNEGHACVLTVSGTAVAAGGEAVFATGSFSVAHIAIVGLDSSRFAVAWGGGPDNQKGDMKVGTVAGADITFGSTQQFMTTTTLTLVKLAKLGANRLSLVYGDSTGADTGYFVECAVSGDTVLFGSATSWFSGATVPTDANAGTAALSGADVIVAYRSPTDGKGYADLLSYPAVTVEAPVDSVALADTVAVRVGAVRADSVPLSDAVDFSGSVAATFAAAAANCKIVALTPTTFLVAYTVSGGGILLSAVVGTLSGEDITFGETLTVSTQWSSDTALAALSSTKAVVAAVNFQASPDDTIDAYVLTVSGTSVTKGAPTTALAADTSSPSLALCALDSSTVVLAYRDGGNSNRGTAKVGTVSGTDITFGAATVFNGDISGSGPIFVGTDLIDICAMTPSTAVVAYKHSTDGDGHACVLTASGTAITAGPPATFETGSQIVAHISVCRLDSARFAVAHKSSGTSQNGYMNIGSVSAGAITFGADQQFLAAATLLMARLAKLGTDRLSLAYVDGTGVASDGLYLECGVSGNTVSFGPPSTWRAGTPTSPIEENTWTAALDGQNVVIVYAGSAGRADLLSYPAVTTTIPPTTTTTAPPETATLSDSVALADSASLRVGVALPDSVGLSDSLSIVGSGTASISDAVGLADEAVLAAGATASDSVSLADSAALGAAAHESDAIPLADSAALRVATAESDAAALSDSAAAALGKGGMSDAVAVADGAAASAGKAAGDAVALVDGVTVFVGKSVRDAVALPDRETLAWTVAGGPPTTTTAIIAQKEAEHQRVTIWDLFAGSADFAAANVHADIAQRLNLSLPGGGLTVALTKGGYRIDYDAEDDTLHVGCDESDPAGRECHAELGSPTESERGPLLVANLYYCERATLLTGIEQFLGMASPTNMEFFVYEAVDDTVLAENIPHPTPLPEPNTSASYGVIDPSTDDADERHRHSRSDFQSTFGLVARFAAGFSAGMRFRSSGPISVGLRQGRFYLVGAAWTSETACFWGGGHPEGTPFGKSLGGLRLAYDGDLPKTLAPTTDASLARPKIDDRAYHQRLTLDGRGIDPGASGASLFVIGPPPVPMGRQPGPPGAAGSLRVGTINATGAGIVRILTNVSVGRVIGGPPPQFFGGSIDPPGPEPEKRYAVKVNRVVYRTRQGSPAACRCHRRFYREPEGWREFRTEAEARAYYDTLEPVARAAIGVTEGGLDTVGCRRGPFRPDSVEFRVANSGAFPVAWSASSDSPWVRLSSAGGSLPNPGDEAKVVASLRGAESLCTGVHTATVTIANETNGVGTAVRAFRLEVRGKPSPEVEPAGDFRAEGRAGGPFAPPAAHWILRNADECPMRWSADWSAGWLVVSPAGGTVPGGGEVAVTASIVAGSLPPDRYADRVVFRNLTSGREAVGRGVTLLILP